MKSCHTVGNGIVLDDGRFLKLARLRWLRSLGWMIGLFALVLFAVGPGMTVVRHILPTGIPQLAFLANIIARPDVSVLLTGGGFGPEASLPALLVCTGVGVGTLWLAWKRNRFNVEAG